MRARLTSPVYHKSRITIDDLIQAAKMVIKLNSLKSVPKRAQKEHWVQGAVLGFLEPRKGFMKLEYPVNGGRLDFYQGGNPPSAIELAVISGKYTFAHLPRINKTEVKKLRSLRYPAKVERFLLLVDLKSSEAMDEKKLEKSYWDYFGKRKFPKNITVLYVHKDRDYHFSL